MSQTLFDYTKGILSRPYIVLLWQKVRVYALVIIISSEDMKMWLWCICRNTCTPDIQSLTDTPRYWVI